MIARVLLAVLLCGVTAGFAMGVVQHLRLTPLILQAETFESSHDHGNKAEAPAAAGHVHDESVWGPADGVERTLYTFAASMLSGTGFAALLAGVALLTGGQISRENGWIWGLAGFIAVSLAPAAGLAPELPSMPSADLTARQLWWVATIASTSAALWLLAFKRQSWAIVAALALALLPHFIGAPQPATHQSAVPASLAAQFAGLSLGANAVMWLIIGTLLGRFLPKIESGQTA
jgi:cobalt transporter subunit CbtA